jgi:DNA-binding transcriptional ArsR family regulator
VAAVKYWVIDNDTLHETDGDEYGKLQNVPSEDDEPIHLLELGDSLIALLERNGIRGVAELVAHSREELGMIPGLGEQKLLRIETVLESSGWRLGDVGSFLEGRNEFRAGLAKQVRREAEHKLQEDERERRETTGLVWPLVSRGLSVEQIVESTLLSRSAVVEARTAWVVQKRNDGASLRQIADEVGLTYQRISQLLRGVGLTGPSEAHTRLRDQGRLEEALQAERLRELIRDVAKSMPGLGVDEVARELGVSQSVVRRHLTRMGSKLVCDTSRSGQKAIWSNEQLLDALRIASTKSTPLTVTAYDTLVTQKQVEGPTGQVFYTRFGSWLEACEAAGVESGERLRDSYLRGWLNADLEALVVEFLFSIERDGSFGDFGSWLQERPDSPSAATVRNRLGTWNEMKRKAIEQIVASGRLSELLDVCE